MISSGRAKLALIAGLAAVVAGFSVTWTTDPPPPTEVKGQIVASGLEGEGSCDVDGVDITYRTSYTPTSGYQVDAAVVSEIAQTCDGGSLRVALMQGASTELAVGSQVVGPDPTITVTFPSGTAAETVDGVRVRITGGDIPIPGACRRMRLDLVQVGSPDDDEVVLGNVSDLFFAQEGSDTIKGVNQSDCIDGGEGDDHLIGGNQDDILLGGAGSDTLAGDGGKDELLGGPGDDVLEGSEGNDKIDGGDGQDRCSGGAGKNTIINCEVVVP